MYRISRKIITNKMKNDKVLVCNHCGSQYLNINDLTSICSTCMGNDFSIVYDNGMCAKCSSEIDSQAKQKGKQWCSACLKGKENGKQ
jgi:hypothetical protein